MDEITTEGGSTEISEPTQEVEVSNEETTTTEGAIEGEGEVQNEQIPDGPDWKKILAGKKVKAYGKEVSLEELDGEDKVLERIQKGYAFDKIAKERADLERTATASKAELERLRQEAIDMMNPSKIMEKNPEAMQAFIDDYMWENYLKESATPEEQIAYEAKKNAREKSDWQAKYEDLNKNVTSEKQAIEQRQRDMQNLEHYGQIVSNGIQNHPMLKNIASNPMVSSEFLYWLRTAEAKGISTTPERLANHTWNSIWKNTILPVLEGVDLDGVSADLDGFTKRFDGHRKGKIVDPERPTATNGEGVVRKPKVKTMDELWDNM